jgi:outer membrane protein OmpA-like peptidoglycan-associated protein
MKIINQEMNVLKNFGKCWTLLITVLMVLILALPAQAQQEAKIKRGKFKLGSDGFKKAWESVKTGDENYYKGKIEYVKARESYLTAQAYNPDNPELNYKIGVCYLFTDNKFLAIDYLKKAYKLKPRVSNDIHFLLGRAYHMVLNFDTAILEYSTFLSELTPKELRLGSPVINELIQQCKNGKEIVKSPVRVIINNLGEKVNSEFDDYNSIISQADTVMFFTSRRPSGKRPKISPVDLKYYEDVYTSKKIDGTWQTAVNMGKPVNTEHHEAAIGLSAGDDKLYLYCGYINGGDIQVCLWKRNKWHKPGKVLSKMNSKLHESSFCISPDTNKIYLVSNAEKKGVGMKDIYFMTRNSKNHWSKPKNLGNIVNSPYDEEAVSLSSDGKTLYFSSRGHNSMGGYDVFKTTFQDNGTWAAPQNLGYPVNTPDDELFYHEDPKNSRFAYYSAMKSGGLGGYDMYKITYLGTEKEAVLSTDEQLYALFTQPVASIFFYQPGMISIDTSMILQGTITDDKTQSPLIARITLIDVEKNSIIDTAYSKPDGSYKVAISAKKTYGVEVMAKDYLFYLDAFDLSKDTGMLVFVHNFALSKVEVGAKVVLKNIFFETGKATLKPESFAELENVQKFLEGNPTVRLEISGHTDNVGSLKTNTKLSQDRAQSVVNYLLSKGVAVSRLEAKGYGFTIPLAPNNTPEGRSLNRRVEFKILSK